MRCSSGAGARRAGPARGGHHPDAARPGYHASDGSHLGSLAPLAEVYGVGGQTAEGLRLVAEALAHVDRVGERFYEAEVYRLKGDLVLRCGSCGPP